LPEEKADVGLIWIAIVMGIVEGLTEFIPVSSTGHLIVTGALLGLKGEKAKTFEVVIQSGAILAVVFYYRDRFRRLLNFRMPWNGQFTGIRGCLLLGITTVPILVMGFFFHGILKAYLFSPLTVAWALGAGGLGILAVERWRPPSSVGSLDGIGWGQALGIGLFQCLALWPGVSRAAATIAGGMLNRLDRKTAAEYSFLAAVPALTAATLYDLYKSWHLLSSQDVPFFAVGFGVSFIAAWFAVAGFLRLLERWTLRPFAWYRIVITPLIYFGLRS
jgi:undecaprenyl-diphosphatase